jgi:hypothetical protein
MSPITSRDRIIAHLAMLLFAGVIALGFTLAALIKHDITTGPARWRIRAKATAADSNGISVNSALMATGGARVRAVKLVMK